MDPSSIARRLCASNLDHGSWKVLKIRCLRAEGPGSLACSALGKSGLLLGSDLAAWVLHPGTLSPE